ncbi:MAG: hypothetical protein KY445_08180 [Armatimonadetes bacterium]|nr:hypothetical protein [Armatimonadota bacterium]
MKPTLCIGDRVRVCCPRPNRLDHCRATGIVKRAYRSKMFGLSYDVEIPCDQSTSGLLDVSFWRDELEWLGEAPKQRVVRCARCGKQSPRLIGISRCDRPRSDGVRCGGVMEEI